MTTQPVCNNHYIADVIPLKHFLKGCRILLSQQRSLSDIQEPIIRLLILTSSLAIISYFTLRLKIKRSLKP